MRFGILDTVLKRNFYTPLPMNQSTISPLTWSIGTVIACLGAGGIMFYLTDSTDDSCDDVVSDLTNRARRRANTRHAA